MYFGSPAEVMKPLEELQRLCAQQPNDSIVAVVSQPPRPVGRKRRLQDPPLAQYAKDQGLTTLQPEKASAAEFLAEMQALEPDLVITAAYGQILSRDFLAIPKLGTINIHPSLLPRYRGATPVQSALLAGETTTGVTILYTVPALDAGDMIVQAETPIQPDERTGELMPRLFALGGDLLQEAFNRISDPNFKPQPQNPEQVTHCRKIDKQDGRIDWHQPAKIILQRYRAFHPWPGSFTQLGEKRIVIDRLRAPEIASHAAPNLDTLEPGAFQFRKDLQALVVGTATTPLLIEALKPEGSKLQDAAAFWNGHKHDNEGIFQ
jgi:methionyl-tRNA formyltransferase